MWNREQSKPLGNVVTPDSEIDHLLQRERERQRRKAAFIGPRLPPYKTIYVDPSRAVVGEGQFPIMLIAGASSIAFETAGVEWDVTGFDRDDEERLQIVRVMDSGRRAKS